MPLGHEVVATRLTNVSKMESKMEHAKTLLCFLTILILTGTTQVANAVLYCDYIGVPEGCVARPGVVLAPAPRVGTPGVGIGVGGVGVGARGVGVGVGGPVNRGGPINRVGRR